MLVLIVQFVISQINEDYKNDLSDFFPMASIRSEYCSDPKISRLDQLDVQTSKFVFIDHMTKISEIQPKILNKRP